MALTGAEKQARLRKRRRENAESYKTYLESERGRKREARATAKNRMTKAEHEEHLARERIRIRSYRLKQKQMKELEKEATTATANPFKNKQSAGKAMKRARASLPVSPRKRKAVAAEMAKEAGLTVIHQKRRHSNGIDEEVSKKVVDFYCLDEVSWQAPGRKDHVIIRSRDDTGAKQKIIVQARYMLMSLSEAYQNFQKTSNDKIGLSKFCELRPKHVKLFDQIPHNVCVCVYHENVRLLLQALKDEAALPDNISDFTELLVCDAKSKDCMAQQCSSCKGRIQNFRPEEENHAMITYYQWQKTDKVELTGTAGEIFAELERRLPKFLEHVHVKRKQSAFMEDLKSKVDGETVLVQVDFSENASLNYQNEVQSVHWSYKQATLFTCHAWINPNENKNLVFISDELDHTKVSVHAFMTELLSTMKKEYPSIKKVHVFSDGAGSQFKQKYLFSNIHQWEEDFEIRLEWHFFATSHGKGVVDGLGGTIKRSVWRHVRSGRAIAADPLAFSQIAIERNPGIKVIYIPKESIQENREHLCQFWEDVVAVPNTHKVHSVASNGPTQVMISETSDAVKIPVRIRQHAVEDDTGASDSGEDGEGSSDQNKVSASKNSYTREDKEMQMESHLSEEEHRQKIEGCLRQFQQYIHPEFTIIPTQSDGNCLFRAVSQQMNEGGHHHTHQMLRRKLVDHMENLPDSDKRELEKSMTTTFNDYVSAMKKDGSYGDHIALVTLSRIFDLQIVVHQESGDTMVGTGNQQIHIGFMPKICHFVALKTVFQPDIQSENCYAVYYTDPHVEFHIGRAIHTSCTCESFLEPHVQMKFLKFDRLSKMYQWARSGLECVPKQCIFFGPVNLVGAGPFKVKNMHHLVQRFDELKQWL